MRKTIVKIICDRCGLEITGDPVRITPHFTKRNPDGSDEFQEGRNELPLWIERMTGKEFCTMCAQKILDVPLISGE